MYDNNVTSWMLNVLMLLISCYSILLIFIFRYKSIIVSNNKSKNASNCLWFLIAGPRFCVFNKFWQNNFGFTSLNYTCIHKCTINPQHIVNIDDVILFVVLSNRGGPVYGTFLVTLYKLYSDLGPRDWWMLPKVKEKVKVQKLRRKL